MNRLVRPICCLALIAAAAIALPLTAPAQEAQGVVDEMARGAVKGLDVNIDFDLAQSSVKKIYAIFSSHWDREYTDPDDVQRDQLIHHIDNLIDTAKANPNFKWCEEGTWHIEGWLRGNPTPERREELYALMRSGRIVVGATQQMIISMPDELNGRVTYEAADLADRNKLKFDTAFANDYVGYSREMIQPLARSGVKYLLNAHHIIFQPHDNITIKDLPFWWEGADGSRILVWRVEYTSGLYPYGVDANGMRFFSGKEIGPEAAKLDPIKLTEVALKTQLKKLKAEGYDKDAILVSCSHDNVLPENAQGAMKHIAEWNKTHTTPQIIVATPDEFFKHMADTYGDKLPVYRGEYPQWFNGAGYDFVPGRRAALDMLEAEKYWSIEGIYGGKGYPTYVLGQELNDIIESAAHGGGAWQATELNERYTAYRRAHLEADIPARAYYARQTGFAALAQKVHTENPSLVVFNNLSWKRSGVAEMTVIDWTFGKDAALVDPETSKTIACEWVPYKAKDATGMDFSQLAKRVYAGEAGYGRVRFYAPNVPAMGYKAFRVSEKSGPPATPQTATADTTTTVANDFYKLTISPNGHIIGLYDQKAKREFIAPDARVPFAQPVANINKVRGKLDFMATELKPLDTEPGKVNISRGPVSTVIHVDRPGSVISATDITLYAQVPQIRIRHTFDSKKLEELDLFLWHKMDIRLPFSFEQDKLQVSIQTGDTVRGKESNTTKGESSDSYATGALGYGTYFTDGTNGMFVSSRETTEIGSGMLFMKPKYPTLVLHCSPGKSPGLGEDDVVELVLTTDKGRAKPAEIYRAAWEGVNPLRANETRRGKLGFFDMGRRFIEGEQQSIVAIDAPNVVLQALKQTRMGKPNEFTLRLLEIGGEKATTAHVKIPAGAKAAWLADQTEHKTTELKIEKDTLTVDLGKSQLVTLRVDW